MQIHHDHLDDAQHVPVIYNTRSKRTPWKPEHECTSFNAGHRRALLQEYHAHPHQWEQWSQQACNIRCVRFWIDWRRNMHNEKGLISHVSFHPAAFSRGVHIESQHALPDCDATDSTPSICNSTGPCIPARQTPNLCGLEPGF